MWIVTLKISLVLIGTVILGFAIYVYLCGGWTEFQITLEEARRNKIGEAQRKKNYLRELREENDILENKFKSK